MKTRIILLCFSILALWSSSCKKTVDSIKEGLLANLITSRQWIIVKYVEGTENKTADYKPYVFTFTKDFKISVTDSSNATVASGTCRVNETDSSLTANFPSAGPPVNRLNGVWTVTNTKSKPWRAFSYRYDNAGTKILLDMQEKQ
jgi:hypothetical protein